MAVKMTTTEENGLYSYLLIISGSVYVHGRFLINQAYRIAVHLVCQQPT
jgi:hypothetical protein